MQDTLRHVKQPSAPPLLPLLRSRVQAEALTTLLLAPEQEWSLTDIARRVGASVATVQREIERAEKAGIVTSRRAGNLRLVRADPAGPLTAPLTELLLRSFGPKDVLAAALLGVGGIDAAYLFGSWAARYEGVPGSPPVDVDVLVIGSPDRDELEKVIEDAEDRLGRPVDVTIRRRSWWDHGDDALRMELARKPIVTLIAAEAER